jgi:hypothetical protein
MVAKVDKLRLDAVTGLGLFQHPASGLVGVRVEPITMAIRGLVVTITSYLFRQVAAALRKASCSNEMN